MNQSLDLNIPLDFYPAKSSPLALAFSRPLGSDDLALPKKAAAEASATIARISDRHHLLAKLLVGGTPIREASIITGYSLARIYSLRGDPAFRNLVTVYRKNADLQTLELQSHIAGMSRDALELLRERFGTDPDSFSNTMLVKIFETTADRSGHSKPVANSSPVTVNIDMSDRITAARVRAKLARAEHNGQPPIDGEIINE